MKKELQKQMEIELEQINAEFHEVIEKKGHCYDRKDLEAQKDCDCVYFYKRWVDTKNRYNKLAEE